MMAQVTLLARLVLAFFRWFFESSKLFYPQVFWFVGRFVAGNLPCSHGEDCVAFHPVACKRLRQNTHLGIKTAVVRRGTSLETIERQTHPEQLYEGLPNLAELERRKKALDVAVVATP